MPPDPGVHVGTASIVIAHGGYLAMLQRDGKEGVAAHGRGTWSVPGGWIDFGENPIETAIREVKEEVGLEVGAPAFEGFAANTHHAEHLHVITLFFRCAYRSGELTNMEPDKCAAVEWVPISEVERRPLFAPLQTFIAKYGLRKAVPGGRR